MFFFEKLRTKSESWNLRNRVHWRFKKNWKWNQRFSLKNHNRTELWTNQVIPLLVQNLKSSYCQREKSSETAVLIYLSILSIVQSQHHIFVSKVQASFPASIINVKKKRIAKVCQLLAAWRKDIACISPKIAKTNG